MFADSEDGLVMWQLGSSEVPMSIFLITHRIITDGVEVVLKHTFRTLRLCRR